MRWIAGPLCALLITLPLPLAAQSGAPSQVMAAFTRLVDRGEARGLFGLPETTFWRRTGGLQMALFADNAAALRPLLEGAAAPFAEVSGLDIAVGETGPAVTPQQDLADLAPEAQLVIVVGPRPALADIAVAGGFDRPIIDLFEVGTWPFAFAFEDDRRRRGVVLLADEGPLRTREAAFILATVWGLGGVTLGPELTGLISDSESGPQLTPLGARVFRLFYHRTLETGMPLAEAVRRAEDLASR
jgi:hypothetical protein